MPEDAETAERPADNSVAALVKSASRWIREAMEGWADDDYEAIALLAPIAVEHLGKAALWRRHPSLLVPLSANGEESLYILTERPDLTNRRLRTIGLSTVLNRLDRCLNDFPLSKERRQRLVDIRNGSVHAGLRTESRHVLTDALTVCGALLADLGLSDNDFYGDQRWNVGGLLSQQRDGVHATVAAKMARARNHLTRLEARLGREVFDQTCAALEANAIHTFEPDVYSSFTRDWVAFDRECPECGSQGRIIGRLEADLDADWDVEPNGDGTYESFYIGETWTLFLTPQSFGCNVCQLSLVDRDELRAGGLEYTRYEVDENDLDSDFDLQDFIRANYYEE